MGVSAKLAGCARWVQHLVEQKADLEVLETLFAKDEISRPALLALVMNSISILELVIFNSALTHRGYLIEALDIVVNSCETAYAKEQFLTFSHMIL